MARSKDSQRRRGELAWSPDVSRYGRIYVVVLTLTYVAWSLAGLAVVIAIAAWTPRGYGAIYLAELMAVPFTVFLFSQALGIATIRKQRIVIDKNRRVMTVHWCVMEKFLVPRLVRRREIPLSDVRKLTLARLGEKAGSRGPVVDSFFIDTRAGLLDLRAFPGNDLHLFAGSLAELSGRKLRDDHPYNRQWSIPFAVVFSLVVCAIVIAIAKLIPL